MNDELKGISGDYLRRLNDSIIDECSEFHLTPEIIEMFQSRVRAPKSNVWIYSTPTVEPFKKDLK